MHHIPKALLVFLYLGAAVLAAPTKPSDAFFKVHRRRALSPRALSGPAALNKAYGKYGWAVTDRSGNTAQSKVSLAAGNRSESGTVKATPEEGDAEFLSPVKIGGQTLMMNFDTGSSDL